MAQFLKTASETLPLVLLQPQSSTTAPGGILGGAAFTNVGTISHPTVTYGAKDATGQRRTNFTGSSSAGSGAGFTQGGTYWYGTNPGDGFDIVVTFDIPSDLTTLGASAFIGLMASAAALAGNPSSLTNIIGIGYDATDALTANISLYTCAGGTAAKTTIPNSGRASLLGHTLTLRLKSINAALVNVSLKDETVVIGNTTGKILLDTDVGVGQTLSAVPAVETLLGFVFNVYNGSVAQSAIIELQKFTASTVA